MRRSAGINSITIGNMNAFELLTQVMIWWGFTTRGETASFVCTIMGPWTWLKKRVTTTYRVIGERNAFASSTLVVEGWR